MTEENNKQTSGSTSQNPENQTGTNSSGGSNKTSGKNSKKARWVILIVLVVLIGSIAVYFLFNNQQWNKIINRFRDQPENVETKTQENPKEKNKAQNNDKLPEDAQKEGLSEGIANDEEITTPDEVDKWQNRLPLFIISHSAYSNEESAKKIKKKLMNMGFNSDYYWIPDYQDSEKQLYKVFIGPYPSRGDAEEMLKAVKIVRKEAYIMKLEGQ